MLKKHSIVIALLLAFMLLAIAVDKYPGGSPVNKYSVGFDFQNNYLCNLFDVHAENGAVNAARNFAILGMFFLCSGFALFFLNMSKKIPVKNASAIIKYAGIVSMLLGFLIVTPFHDAFLSFAGLLAFISIISIVIYVMKTKLVLFKILSILCLMVFFICNAVYYSRVLINWLPILQKTGLILSIIWMLGLNYFTNERDFSNEDTLLPTINH
ncbi:MAG: hypothetical protein RLY16_2528 [Bacteroidota bacterium]